MRCNRQPQISDDNLALSRKKCATPSHQHPSHLSPWKKILCARRGPPWANPDADGSPLLGARLAPAALPQRCICQSTAEPRHPNQTSSRHRATPLSGRSSTAASSTGQSRVHTSDPSRPVSTLKCLSNGQQSQRKRMESCHVLQMIHAAPASVASSRCSKHSTASSSNAAVRAITSRIMWRALRLRRILAASPASDPSRVPTALARGAMAKSICSSSAQRPTSPTPRWIWPHTLQEHREVWTRSNAPWQGRPTAQRQCN